MAELYAAAQSLRDGKAAGPDLQPGEYWKVVLARGGAAAGWLLQFCNACWEGRTVPHCWHTHQVALLYKKDDPSDCGNYRPICLLNTAYKIFAAILLRLLNRAEAAERISCSQFGFRKRRGTEELLTPSVLRVCWMLFGDLDCPISF